jgi:hypothetical protein
MRRELSVMGREGESPPDAGCGNERAQVQEFSISVANFRCIYNHTIPNSIDKSSKRAIVCPSAITTRSAPVRETSEAMLVSCTYSKEASMKRLLFALFTGVAWAFVIFDSIVGRGVADAAHAFHAMGCTGDCL